MCKNLYARATIAYNCGINTALNGSDNLHSYPIENYHSSHDAYWSSRRIIMVIINITTVITTLGT